ncbi:MAG: glycosyl hydrolase 108 family protein [Zavarzinia sp.]|nr:glycosyl hydrolase 108 family protein [Zavarzinia sp.]
MAVDFLLAHEGGLVDDKDDPGGVTNFGVSLRFARRAGDLDGDGHLDLDFDGDGDVDADDVRAMTREDAAEVYWLHWWQRLGYGSLPLRLGVKALDLSVNMGAVQAHKILQRACWAHGHREVIDDGQLGPKSRSVIAGLGNTDLLPAIRSEAAGFYRGLAISRPRSAKYLGGWLNRAYA